MIKDARSGAVAMVCSLFAGAECYEPKQAVDLATETLKALGCTVEEIIEGYTLFYKIADVGVQNGS